jgi:hypothetical protein
MYTVKESCFKVMDCFPVSSVLEDSMLKSDLLRLLQQEIRRHGFDYFIDEPPSIAQGGKGVVVPGCPVCRKRLQSMTQFVEHLAVDVLPRVIDGLKA